MRSILFLASLFCVTVLQAQDTLKLSINNPAPRLGEEVELSLSLDFLAKEIESQLNDGIDLLDSPSYSGGKKLLTKLVFSNVGVQQVGPFQFNFNGKEMLTDVLTVDVAEKLPFEEGVWFRSVTDSKGDQFLIIEQYMNNESNYQKEELGFSYTVGGVLGEGKKYVEIDDTSKYGIEFDFKQSNSTTKREEGSDPFSVGMSYSFKKYLIVFDDSFSGSFTLKKKHLKNVPKKTAIENIVITK